jgi:hypothetical protein
MQHFSFLSKKILYIASALACALAVFIGYYLQRAHFTALLVSMSAFFLIYTYFIAFFNQNESTFGWMRSLGVLLRVILLLNIPNLSDDIYRFLWDGHLWLTGTHPFAFTPDEYVKLHGNLGPFESILYANMNSRAFFTVYPPICQFIFALASWFSPNGILGAVFIIKLFLLLCELGTIQLLKRLSGPRASILYALNPLIIVELVGNCHFEAALIFFLLMAFWALRREQMALSAMFFALSIASKLLPILFLPIVWRYLGWWRGFQYCVMVGMATFLCFIPIFNWEVLQHMASSIDLYFQKFQFNASLYYLCTLVGYWETGWQIGSKIGPWLGIVTILGIVLIACFTETQKKASWIRFESALLFASFLHLSLSSTVHSWYASVPFVLGLLSKWHFPFAWSFLVLCSYSHYSSNIYEEKYPWIIAEYSLLWIILLVELVKQLKPNAST